MEKPAPFDEVFAAGRPDSRSAWPWLIAVLATPLVLGCLASFWLGHRLSATAGSRGTVHEPAGRIQVSATVKTSDSSWSSMDLDEVTDIDFLGGSVVVRQRNGGRVYFPDNTTSFSWQLNGPPEKSVDGH